MQKFNIFASYTLFSRKLLEDILQQHERERGRHGFQKAKTVKHENNEGKSMLTAMPQPRKQLVQMETRGKMASGGTSQGRSLTVLVFTIVFQYLVL